MSPDGTEKHGSVPPPEERRRYVRVRKEVKLTCRIIGEPPKEDVLPMRNLGTGGLLLSMREPLHLGTRLQLRATIPSAGIEFSMGGRVVWCEFNGTTSRHEAGVCFVGLDPGQRQNVMALIGAHLAEASGLERRHFIRLWRRQMVEYRVGTRFFHRWHTASTQDISLGGLALLVDRHFAPGTAMSLRIYLEDAPDKPLAADCVVVGSAHRDNRPGEWVAHVHFQHMATEAHERLAAYISKALSAPAIDAVTQPKGGGSKKGTG